jgi:hypothetical protein
MTDFDDTLRPSDPIADIWEDVQGKDELDQKLTVDISLWLEGDIYLNTDRTSTACGISQENRSNEAAQIKNMFVIPFIFLSVYHCYCHKVFIL